MGTHSENIPVYRGIGTPIDKYWIFLNNFSGKVAWGKKFEDEASQGGFQEQRGARQAGYIPTFYTSASQAAPQYAGQAAQPVHFESAAHPSYARSARDSTYYEQPLYYYSSE